LVSSRERSLFGDFTARSSTARGAGSSKVDGLIEEVQNIERREKRRGSRSVPEVFPLLFYDVEFILGCLDEDELKAVYRHFDECGECVRWLAGVIRAEAYE